MKMDMFASLRLAQDQDVMVASTHGKYYGKFISLSSEGNRLNLREVRAEDGHKTGKFKFFFKKDVVAVEVLGKTTEAASGSSGSTDTILSSRGVPCVETSSDRPAKLSEKQLAQISKNIDQYVYIQQTDVKYHEAIADISENFVIGVDAEQTEKGR